MFFAVLFLYSGRLWITMLVHAFHDILGFSITTLGEVGESVVSPFAQTGLILMLWLSLSLIVFLCKRKTIEKNAVLFLERFPLK